MSAFSWRSPPSCSSPWGGWSGGGCGTTGPGGAGATAVPAPPPSAVRYGVPPLLAAVGAGLAVDRRPSACGSAAPSAGPSPSPPPASPGGDSADPH